MLNVLGNPAISYRMTVGVAERELGYTFSQSLHQGGMQRALVVCGYEKIIQMVSKDLSHPRTWDGIGLE